MLDFVEIKINQHTRHSSIWGKVQVVSSVQLCISTARIGNTWASMVEKDTETFPSVYSQGHVLFAVIYFPAVPKVWQALWKWIGRRDFGPQRLWSPWAKTRSEKSIHNQSSWNTDQPLAIDCISAHFRDVNYSQCFLNFIWICWYMFSLTAASIFAWIFGLLLLCSTQQILFKLINTKYYFLNNKVS